MSSAANAEHFAQSHWRVIASGHDVKRWFQDGQAVGTGGILNPSPTQLPAGQALYRFASSQTSREAQFGGGWWVDFENFRSIRAFADEHGYSLREAARLMLALPYAWTRVDRLLKAFPLQPLKAWTGLGKPADAAGSAADRGTRWIPTQHLRIRQCYIPGLYVRPDPDPLVARPRRQLFETVFAQPVAVEPLR